MAASVGMHGYGTKLYYSTVLGGSPTNQLAVEITSIDYPETETDDIDVTHMESPDKYREYVPGLSDGGELEVECNYTDAGYSAASALTTAALGDDAKRTYRIEMPSGATFDFPGYIKNVGGTSPFDDKATMNITLRVAGSVTFTPGA